MTASSQDFATFFGGLVEDHKAHIRAEAQKYQRRLPWVIGSIRNGIMQLQEIQNREEA